MPRTTSLPKTRAMKLSLLINLSILIIILLLSGLLVKRIFFDEFNAPVISPGAKIFIKGVDLTKTDRTLLLAIRKDCKYCTESARFYRRLADSLANRTDVRIVALFPQSAPGSDEYLRTLGLAASESQQAPLLSLGIQYVPTLVLVDKNGLVSNTWAGRLSPRQETEVMTRLQLEDTRPISDWTIEEAELKRRLNNREPIVILDLRERSRFAQGQLPNAKNIPLDELYIRAINELAQDDVLVLYDDSDIQADYAYRLLKEQGFSQVFILSKSTMGQ